MPSLPQRTARRHQPIRTRRNAAPAAAAAPDIGTHSTTTMIELASRLGLRRVPTSIRAGASQGSVYCHTRPSPQLPISALPTRFDRLEPLEVADQSPRKTQNATIPAASGSSPMAPSVKSPMVPISLMQRGPHGLLRIRIAAAAGSATRSKRCSTSGSYGPCRRRLGAVAGSLRPARSGA